MCFRPPSIGKKTVKCPVCGAENLATATKCVKCGAEERTAGGAPPGRVAPPLPKAPPPRPMPKAPPAPPGPPKKSGDETSD
jgi:hypothetical protein